MNGSRFVLHLTGKYANRDAVARLRHRSLSGRDSSENHTGTCLRLRGKWRVRLDDWRRLFRVGIRD